MLRLNIFTLILAGTLGLVLTNFNANAESFKWIDASGKTHYTDSPPPDGTVHKQIDLGECKTDECKKDLQQVQEDAAKQIQETENWLRKRETGRSDQEQELRKPKYKPKASPANQDSAGH